MMHWLIGLALAADPAMQQAAKMRHQNFELLGDHYETLEKEAKRRTPRVALMQEKAAEIDRLAREQGTWFPAGSGPESGIKTKAKAEVWTKPAEFQQIHDRFLVEAGKLKEIAAGGDAAAIKAQTEVTGAACSDCHNTFRKQGGIMSLFGG
jgi:cytochrome c556